MISLPPEYNGQSLEPAFPSASIHMIKIMSPKNSVNGVREEKCHTFFALPHWPSPEGLHCFKAMAAFRTLHREETIAQLPVCFGGHWTTITAWERQLLKGASELFAKNHQALVLLPHHEADEA